jgi:GTP-binding protein
MKIKSAEFITSAPDLDSCPESVLHEFAFIGRSNVGKSSLLNMLAGRNALAKVSATPGHTRLINFFLINNAWSMVDLPGYGYASTSKENRLKYQDMIVDYMTKRQNLACVFVLIDSRHSPQVIDLEFVQWLMGSKVPMVLVFTKADKPSATLLQKNIELFKESMSAWCEGFPKIFTSSTATKQGRSELLGFISNVVHGGGVAVA